MDTRVKPAYDAACVLRPCVPDAVRHSSCRSAEPGPRLSKQAGPRLSSAPRREVRRAAQHPGNAESSFYFRTQITRSTEAFASDDPPVVATPLAFRKSRTVSALTSEA